MSVSLLASWASRRGRIATATFVAAVAVAVPSKDALAYCRSTTCVGDCERDEEGCKTTGTKLFWTSRCVGVSLQEDSSEFIPFKYFEQTAQKAFVEWSDLECETGTASIAFSQVDEVACREAEYNSGGTNANILIFQDTRWEYTGVENNLAKTTVTFNDETGEILDADIEFNHANNHFTISDMVIEYDLQAIMTHEIGHMIGIDHSADFSATMYAGYEVGTTEQRTLEVDDILAVCDAYPPEREATCAPDPRGGLGYECGGVANEDGGDDGGGGCSASCATSGSASSWPVAALAFALLALTRKNHRRS